jgi:hypothetical protein
VGHPDGQAGLADPALARDGHDPHRVRRVDRALLAAAVAGQDLPDRLDVALAAGEVGDAARQLARHHRLLDGALDGGPFDGDALLGHRRRPGAAGRQVQRPVPVQDRPLQVLQLLPGLDAELLDQQRAGAAADVERLGLAAGPVQRQHQEAVQPLPQRELVDQGGQFAADLLVPPQC